MDQKKTGQFLKTLRNEKNLTQEQLARKFGVSSRSVSRWETGSNLPDISLLVEIADFYDVDVREIIDGERKSEMMDKEIREVAGKMADYAGNEKHKLLRFVQIAGITGIVLTILALIFLTVPYEPGRLHVILLTFTVFLIMSVITLYVTGLLQRLTRHRRAIKAIKITLLVLVGLIVNYMAIMVLIVGLAGASMLIARVEQTDDPSLYNKYINCGDAANGTEYGWGNHPEFDLFPEKLEVEPEALSITYYNPWDPQYIVYMTLDLKDGYDEELKRVKAFGIADYKGMYTVTGEPEGYDIVAMIADGYHGFIYAMIPEGAKDNTKITYCAVWFCNYALDINVHRYMPDKYLLPGFDGSDLNPYKRAHWDDP